MKYTNSVDICQSLTRGINYSGLGTYSNLDWIYQQYVDIHTWNNTHWITIL